MKSETIRFRDKAIRSLACAAICGLSVSFAMGEVIDAQSHLLKEWQNDPALLPNSFPAAQPYKELAKALELDDWQNDFKYLNGRDLGPVPLTALTVHEEPITIPPFRVLLAEAKLAARARKLQTSKHPANIQEKQLDQIHHMLLSVQETEAKLTGGNKDTNKNPGPALAMAKEKPNTARKDMISSLAAAPDSTELSVIHGRLMPVGSGIMNGHFEVGLYSSVNSMGNPVGFPLAQQILPAGQTGFELNTSVEQGYLFARYSSDDSENLELWFHPINNPLLISAVDMSVDIPVHPPRSSHANASALLPNEKEISIRGHVGTMFSHQGQILPQGGATVRVRGTNLSTFTNAKGDFLLSIPAVDGPILIEVAKPGYMATIVRAGPQEYHDGLNVELASKSAVDQMAGALGIRQAMAKSVFLGRTQNLNGQAIQGISAQLTLHADGPYYFSREGFPASTSAQRATSGDGRFVFFNVESGVGYLNAMDQSNAMAPVIISAVEGGGLIYKGLTPVEARLRGKVFNPVASRGALNERAVVGARVRLSGGSDFVVTDNNGAFDMSAVKLFRNEDFAIELTAEKYYNHKYGFTVSADIDHPLPSALNLFAFPSSYINSMASSVDVDWDSSTGIIIGGIGQKALRVDALAEHAEINNAKDFYFDAQGSLKGSFAQTDKKFGTYIVFNVPKGRVLLHGLDSAGNMRYSGITYPGEATVNVVLPESTK